VSDDSTAATAATLPSRVSAFAPLRYRNFRLLWTGLIISNIGSWMQFVALGYLVDRLTGSPVYLGLLAATQAVPRLVFALVGGTTADRVDRRGRLLAPTLVLMTSAAALAVLTVTGRIQIWQIFVIGGVNSLVQAFDMPARHSMVPSLVAEHEIFTAISLNSVAFNGAGIIGPSVGGILIAAVGESGAFFVNAGTYCAVLAALLLMSVPRQERVGRVRVSEDLREGLALLRHHPQIVLLLGTIAVLSFFGRPYVRLMPSFAREVVHVGAEGLGLLQSAPGIGTVAALLLVGWLSTMRGKGGLLSLATLGFGGAVAVFGLMRWFWPALLMLVAVGSAQALAMASANTLLQMTVPAHARGRAMGLYSMVAFGGFALGSLPVGMLADVVGVGPALSAGGAVVVLIALVVLPRLKKID
jgi:MFS family permease